MSNFKISIGIVAISLLLQVFHPQITKAQNLSPFDSRGSEGDLLNLPVSDEEVFNRVGGILPQPIADLFRDIVNIVGRVNTFLAELGLEVDIGVLGLPDISEAIEVFKENNQIDIAGDVFGTQTGSTVVLSDSLYKQYLKDLGREYAQNSTLSKEGQEKTSEQIRLAAETAEISSSFAQDSNQQDVSQNILRNISNQLALLQQLDNISFFGLQEDKIARSLELSIAGETVVAIDRLTTIRDREASSLLKASTYHQGLISIPGQHLTND